MWTKKLGHILYCARKTAPETWNIAQLVLHNYISRDSTYIAIGL